MAAHNNDNRPAVLEEALNKFIDAYLQGRQPDIDEFVTRYPQCEIQLKKRIQDLREINSLFDSIFHADQSDFEDAAAEEDLIGRKVGGFEIVNIIGRGGMGVVYLARDTKLKRSVAVKSMPASLAENSTARTRFRREAELLASLNHPNIAVIYEILEEEKAGYLVLEHVPGETLSERISREPLKLEQALTIGRQIAEAVSAAHKKGIVHRDLKPGNIKITPEGRIKVLDFGLAKASVSEAKSDEITETHPGRVIGTPAYMSPEQARGKETDHRTDIWSFGCIMYQMLTNRLPFEGDTATDTLARIIEREPDWNALPKQIPSNIRTLLKRCLEKDPDRRLGDISEAVLEISETLNTQPMPLPVRLRRISIIIFATIAVTLTGVATWFALTFSEEISLLVLPFENPVSAEDVDLANGIMDEIKARLTGINGLRAYKSREKGAKSMAMELGLDYILEGTLLREEQSDPNSPVRIKARLIRASDESLVSEQPYIHVGEIFQTSSDLALKVVEALNITLLEQQRRVLESEPNVNPEAYHYYVRGNEYSSRTYQDKGNLLIAIEMYERAVGLDDNFALAHARLSEVYCGMYKFQGRSEEYLAKAWEASEKALTLDPDLPEGHWARGVYYYWGPRNYDSALEEFGIARKSQPDNSQVLRFIGYVKRQQGKYEEALDYLREASEHDPLSNSLAMAIGNTLNDMRKYAEAEYCYERAISLAPDQEHPHYVKAALYLLWKGSTKEARAALKRASKYTDFADNENIVNLQYRLDVLDGNYPEALARLPLTSPSIDDLNYPDALRYAQVYGYMGDRESELKFYEKLRSILGSRLEERPNSCELHCRLGITYAALGFKDKAIEEGKYGVKLAPTTKLYASLFNTTKDLATIYMMVGDYDTAIDKIEYLLTIPGYLSIPLLYIDSLWNPLRDHPRFKELLESGM